MSEQPYKQPPITEAVIEFRFAAPVEASDIAKVSADFASLYPLQHPAVDFRVHVNLTSGPQSQDTVQRIETHGSRLSTEDQAQIFLIWPTNFVFSQLSPYPGWNVFFERFQRDWTIWKKALGYRKITRIGMRYINRIDIPVTDGPVIEYEDYLNIYPHLPTEFPPLTGYSVAAQFPIPDIRGAITINSLSVPSPLLGHAAFTVDLDIAREDDPPQNDDSLYALLNQIRVKKNEIFEACIKPRARELFKPWQA